MAGRLSLAHARKQGAAQPCTDCDEEGTPTPQKRRVVRVPAEAFAVGPGYITNPVGTNRLMEYWAHGKGARKIRWFTDGSFRRCVKQLRKYFPANTSGLCANLHKRATGEWPREKGIPS